MKQSLILFSLTLFIVQYSFSQSNSTAPDQARDLRPFKMQLEGYSPDIHDHRNTSFVRHGGSNAEPRAPYEAPHRSPFISAVLSLAVPGAGEVYTESYIKAGIFLVAEVVGWYFNIKYNKKGDDQTDLFQNYADARWSVVRYAEWLNKFRKNFNGGDNPNLKDISINPNTSLPPWERVDWDAMRAIESAIPEFSHRLPPHGDQQYYELIGKYQQYNHGWDDSDPTTYKYYENLSLNFLLYSQMRGTANDYYNTAKTVVTLIVINHILSAADAAWSASLFNSRYQIHSRIELRQTPFGLEPVPTAHFTMRF